MIRAANKNNEYISNRQLLLLFFPLLAIIILWFGHWQTQVIYGDDLGIYESYRTKTDLDIILESEKYRPINTWMIKLLIATLGKHIPLYFYFNAMMQAICTLLFIKIANLFLKDILFSFHLGLLVALSRFNFYNLTQLYNGGAMEVLAMIFFMGGLYYWLKAAIGGKTEEQNFRWLLTSAMLTNLCIYTHERYIVFFIFLLCALPVPALSRLKIAQKLKLAAIILASVGINYFIKQQIYHISFFVGTGNTHIDLSPLSAAGYLKDALLDMFQFNTGPEYLSGLPYPRLTTFHKSLPIITSLYILLTIAVYLAIKRTKKPQYIGTANSGYVVLALFGLLLLTVGPAIVTIRLEQRWLQAAFAVLLIIVAACVSSVSFNKIVSYTGLFTFVSVFLLSERNYLVTGVPDIYLSSSVRKATLYKRAIDNKIIDPAAKCLVIVDNSHNANSKAELKWVLQNGAFFDFYETSIRNIQLVDSAHYQFLLSTQAFVPVSSQCIGQNGDTIFKMPN